MRLNTDFNRIPPIITETLCSNPDTTCGGNTQFEVIIVLFRELKQNSVFVALISCVLIPCIRFLTVNRRAVSQWKNCSEKARLVAHLFPAAWDEE